MQLGVPVLIQVINTGDAAPVTIWVVHMTNVPGSISRITSDHGLGALLHVVLAEPAPAVHHQAVYQREEEVDGLAALLRAPDPLDLVATEVPLGDAAARAGQLPIGQLPVAVHPLHPLQHAVPHHLPQEVVQVAEADVVQAGHDVLQGDPLQVQPHDVPQRHGTAGTPRGTTPAGARPSTAGAPAAALCRVRPGQNFPGGGRPGCAQLRGRAPRGQQRRRSPALPLLQLPLCEQRALLGSRAGAAAGGNPRPL